MFSQPQVTLLRDRAVIHLPYLMDVEELGDSGRFPVGQFCRYTTLRPARRGVLVFAYLDVLDDEGTPQTLELRVMVPPRGGLWHVIGPLWVGVVDAACAIWDWLAPNWLRRAMLMRNGE